MKRRIRGRAFVEGVIHDDVTITIDGALISDLVVHRSARAGDQIILPGLIDIHVHGGLGADFSDASEEAMATVTRFHLKSGTTSLAATTISASRKHLHRVVEAIARHASLQTSETASIVALHLEGPFINPSKCGAHERVAIRPPDPVELAELFTLAEGLPRIVTFAPELDGSMDLLDTFAREAVFSIGHTEATFAEAMEAFRRGARHVTHLGNAMRSMQQREPGVIGAAFDGAHTAELVGDGHHLHPAFARATSRAMPGRVALVSDAIRGCGMPDGRYSLGGLHVYVSGGSARLADGTIAGSVTTLFDCVRAMSTPDGLPLETVIGMATNTPARILGMSDRIGSIRPGLHADLLVVSSDLDLRRVIHDGDEIDIRGVRT